MRFQPSRLRHRPTPKMPMPCIFEPALGRELLALRGSCPVVQVSLRLLAYRIPAVAFSAAGIQCESREASEGPNTEPKSSVPVAGRLVNPAASCSR